MSVLVLSGECILSYRNEEMKFKKESSVFVHADFNVKLIGKLKIIVSNV